MSWKLFSCSSHGLPSKKDSKPFQAQLKWFCHRRRFTCICSTEYIVTSLGLMLGLRSGCGSWSKNSKTWWSAYIFWETQLRWGQVGKACASTHQLKLAELNEGKRFIIFPRASIPSVYPIFRHKWRIQQDAKHQKFDGELWSRPTAVLCALNKAHVWLVESPFCLVCIGWINMFVCENCGCVLTAPVLVLFKVQFLVCKMTFLFAICLSLANAWGSKNGPKEWRKNMALWPWDSSQSGSRLGHRKSPWWLHRFLSIKCSLSVI